MIRESIITCPECGTAKSETMPTDACQFFYVCTGCRTKLRPKSGDCCVFCSYVQCRVRQCRLKTPLAVAARDRSSGFSRLARQYV